MTRTTPAPWCVVRLMRAKSTQQRPRKARRAQSGSWLLRVSVVMAVAAAPNRAHHGRRVRPVGERSQWSSDRARQHHRNSHAPSAAIVVFAVMPISSHCCSRPKSGLIVNSPPPRSWPNWPVRRSRALEVALSSNAKHLRQCFRRGHVSAFGSRKTGRRSSKRLSAYREATNPEP
jgi:hypothetical protein